MDIDSGWLLGSIFLTLFFISVYAYPLVSIVAFIVSATFFFRSLQFSDYSIITLLSTLIVTLLAIGFYILWETFLAHYTLLLSVVIALIMMAVLALYFIAVYKSVVKNTGVQAMFIITLLLFGTVLMFIASIVYGHILFFVVTLVLLIISLKAVIDLLRTF